MPLHVPLLMMLPHDSQLSCVASSACRPCVTCQCLCRGNAQLAKAVRASKKQAKRGKYGPVPDAFERAHYWTTSSCLSNICTVPLVMRVLRALLPDRHSLQLTLAV